MHMNSRSLYLVPTVLAAGLLTAACGDGPAATSAAANSASVGSVATGPADKTVTEMSTQKFDPAAVTVKVGQTVAWKNTDTVTHTVTFAGHDDISNNSMDAGQTFEVKFTVPGSYAYTCTIHSGMTGAVTVTP